MDQLLDSVRLKDELLAEQWASSEHWATVEQIIQAHGKVENNLIGNLFH